MSGKRRAEKYLTDRNVDDEDGDDEIQIIDGSTGFKQASDKEIATRPMRGLPGRKSTTGSPAPASSKPSTPAPAFGGFGTPSATSAAPAKPSTFAGFSFTPSPGASTAATNGTPASQLNGHAPAFSFATNGSSAPAMQTQKSGSSLMPATNGSPESDPEVTYFTSIRGLNTSVIAPIQRLLDQDPFKDLSSALEQIAKSYKEQRLKIQLKRDSAISRASAKVNGDPGRVQAAASAGDATTTSTSAPATDKPKAAPFAGFAFGQPASAPVAATAATTAAPSTAAPAPAAIAKPAATTPAFSFAPAPSAKPAEQNQPKPPAPPAAFTFAGQSFKPDASASASASNSTPAPTSAGAFVFDPSKSKGSEKSSFTFPAASAAPAEAQKPEEKSGASSDVSSSSKTALPSGISPLMPANASRARQPSPLRQVETVPETETKKAEATTKEAPKPFSGFSFTASASGPAKTVAWNPPASSFAMPSTQPAPAVPSTPSKATPPTPTASSPKGSSAFTFGTAPGAAQTSPKAFNSSVGFSFGGGSSSTPLSTNAAPSSGFSFGKPAATPAEPAKAAPLFSWGAPASGATPAVAPSAFSGGFSFGKPSTSTAPAVSAFGSSSTPAFSFAAPTASTSAASSASGTPAPPDADEDAPPVVNPADNSLLGNGAGEENEDTVYEVRCKLWKLEDNGKNEGKKTYVEYGVNNLRIKRDKTSGKTRILCRGDANGKVNVNFAVHKALDVKVEKTYLHFLGFDEAGQPLPLRVRVKTLDGAKQLKEEIDAVVPR